MSEQTWEGNKPAAQNFLQAFLQANHFGYSEIDASSTRESCTSSTAAVNAEKASEASLRSHTETEFNPSQVLQQSSPQSHTNMPSNVAESQIVSGVPVWKQKIIDKNDENKREINKIGDDFTDKAIVRIEGLPEDRREKAAEEYIRSTNYIMKGVKNVMDFSIDCDEG